MQVLNDYQIKQKIQRLSYEILENNLDEDEIILVGINNNGYGFAKLLFESLTAISDKKVVLSKIKFRESYSRWHSSLGWGPMTHFHHLQKAALCASSSLQASKR